MVAADIAQMRLEVRAVGSDDFDAIYPLLELFNNKKMSRSDWRAMLFDYPWWRGPERGFALYDHGVPVGFLGTIYSERRVNGKPGIFCNASSWIVRERYRTASLMLLKPLLAQRECTILNLTPTQRSYSVFEKFGFLPLESEQLLLFPFGSPVEALVGTFASRPSEVASALPSDERNIFADLASVERARHIVLHTSDGPCYIVATPLRVKRLPFAEVHYIGNKEAFWKHRALVHRALLEVMGAIGVAVDRRYAGDRTVAFARSRPAKRLFRPGMPSITAQTIDTLFSELMSVKI